MSLEAGAVKKKSWLPFLAASAFFFGMAAAMAGLYFYEESKITLLTNEIQRAQITVKELKNLNQTISAQNAEAEAKLDEKKVDQQKMDDLAGKVKVLQYEKETLESDNAAKEKKIAELQDEVSRQDAKEEKLMALIEQAKKQIAAQTPPPSLAPAVPSAEVKAPITSAAPGAADHT